MSDDDGSKFTINVDEFQRSSATERFHGSPRFGKSREFSDLWKSDDAANGYIAGLLFAGIFIACIILAWIVALLVLKCVPGTGFMRGNRFQADKVRRNRIIRSTFMISALLVLIFAILGITEGLTQLNNTVDTMNYSAQLVEGIARDGRRYLTSLQENRNSTLEVLPKLVEAVEGSCINDAAIDAELDAVFTEAADEIVRISDELGDILGKELPAIAELLHQTEKTSAKFVDETNDIDINDWQSLIVIIPFSILTPFLVIAAALAWKGIEFRPLLCVTYWVVLPLFIFFVLVLFVISAVVVILASANADFCSGGTQETPEQTILEVLQHEDIPPGDFTYDLVDFYVTRCAAEDALLSVRDFSTLIKTAEQRIDEFNSTLYEVGPTAIADLCGAQNAPDIFNWTTVVAGNVIGQVENVVNLLSLASCNRIVPLYINTFQTGTCEYSVTGVTWLFSGFLIVGIFGFVMITFRSSLLPDADEQEGFEKDQPYYDEGFEANAQGEVAETGVEASPAGVEESIADGDVYMGGSEIQDSPSRDSVYSHASEQSAEEAWAANFKEGETVS